MEGEQERKRKEKTRNQEQRTRRKQEKNDNHMWTKWLILIGTRSPWPRKVWGKLQGGGCEGQGESARGVPGTE